MQYILDENEYKELKNKEEMLNSAYKYISDHLIIDNTEEYLRDWRMTMSMSPHIDNYPKGDVTLVNFDIPKLFELLGIKLDRNISIKLTWNK